MKRNNEGEKIMGPMFPRLHVNDTEKGGPRAPPRNKMALYEQLSIPSHRLNHAVMPRNPTNNATSTALSSRMGGGNHRGSFSACVRRHAYPSQDRFTQYSESSTSPPPQVEPRKKIYDNDNRVPIFVQPIPQEFDKYSSGFLSNPPYSDPPLKFHQTNEMSTLEVSIGDEGQIKKRENSNAVSSEKDDTVSETSILDTESALEITPDDVVGAMGQQHFWRARRAIMNQQRVFAVQVFELHRLIKVQRSIAASPHLLHDDAAYLDDPTNPLPAKKRPLDYTDNTVLNTENASHKKERSAENTVEKEKTPLSLAQNGAPASTVASTDRSNARTSYFNHPSPHGHQWLIPIMSPSEGLVYKPCSGPGFLGPIGSNPTTIGNFVAPFLPSPSHPFPPFYGPHYSMPVMSSAAFSARESTSDQPVSKAGPGQRATEEIKSGHSRVSNGILQCFPISSPATTDPSESSCRVRAAGPGPRVIKVVPHNAISASESAARIFKSIQEERKLYCSV